MKGEAYALNNQNEKFNGNINKFMRGDSSDEHGKINTLELSWVIKP
jgi:hypothetical protein